MTGQQKYEAAIRWRESCAVRPYVSITGTLVGIEGDMIGLLGSDALISFSRLSLGSQKEIVEENVGLPVTLKVRG